MITCENIYSGYGAHDVVRGVSAAAKSGHFIGLLGPNGSGKSTLLHTLCGLRPLRRGTLLLNAQPLDSYVAAHRARQIAILPQTRMAAPHMSAADIIRLGRAPYRGRLGRISAEGHTQIETAISQTHTQTLLDRRFDQLSGGEQARVLLARALAVGAKVLLADEPIAALDPYFQLSLMQTLHDHARQGHVVIAALHDLALAHQFCDQIWVMEAGCLVKNGPPRTALSEETLNRVFGVSQPKGGFTPLTLSPSSGI